jgi:hypothetical protein
MEGGKEKAMRWRPRFSLFFLLLGVSVIGVMLGITVKVRDKVMVSGRVTYQGRPVPTINVMLLCIENGEDGPRTMTDDFGKFTFPDGCRSGRYRVRIIYGEPLRTKLRLSPIPSKYGELENSGLAIYVSRFGRNHVHFDLQ